MYDHSDPELEVAGDVVTDTKRHTIRIDSRNIPPFLSTCNWVILSCRLGYYGVFLLEPNELNRLQSLTFADNQEMYVFLKIQLIFDSILINYTQNLCMVSQVNLS